MVVKLQDRPVAEEPEVVADGTENADDQEGQNVGSESGAEQDTIAGGEGGEAGKGGESDQGESGEGAESKLTEKDVEIARLQERLAALEKGQSKPEPVKEWTEDQWNEHAERTGLTKAGTQYIAQLLRGVLAGNNVTQQEMTNRLARFEKNDAVNELGKEKEYSDIPKYRTGMDEFLNNYEPHLHSNKKLLGLAYYYAKGKGASGAVKKASNANELNRKIVSKAALNQGGKAKEQGKAIGNFKLTASEESAFETHKDLFKDKNEYIQNLPRYRKVV